MKIARSLMMGGACSALCRPAILLKSQRYNDEQFLQVCLLYPAIIYAFPLLRRFHCYGVLEMFVDISKLLISN